MRKIFSFLPKLYILWICLYFIWVFHRKGGCLKTWFLVSVLNLFQTYSRVKLPSSPQWISGTFEVQFQFREIRKSKNLNSSHRFSILLRCFLRIVCFNKRFSDSAGILRSLPFIFHKLKIQRTYFDFFPVYPVVLSLDS